VLCPRDRLADYAGFKKPEPGAPSGLLFTHNVGKKEEVAEVLALAEKAGAKIIEGPHDVFWGGHVAFFADPDGYNWEIAWAPARAGNDQRAD
jgi:uncharacterized glyoxalase superfamily protein PhnB